MPSDAYIKAASADNREPVIHLALESIDAIKRQITTQADWVASKSISDGLRTDLEPQSVRMEHAVIPSPVDAYGAVMVSPAFVSWPTRFGVFPLFWEIGGTHTKTTVPFHPGFARIVFRDAVGGPIIGFSRDFAMEENWLFIAGGKGFSSVEIFPFLVAPSSTIYAQVEGDFVTHGVGRATCGIFDSEGNSVAPATVEFTAAAGTLQTKTIDLGLTPVVDTLVTFDDLIPYPSSIAITARGSDNETDWTDLGTVTNGTDIAPYRYYDFTAVMTSNGAHPILREIAVQGGDAQYLHFSTHRDLPVVGALPLIVPGSVGTLSTKLDLMKTPTTAEINLALFWTAATGDLIATGYPKNKIARIRHGYVGISESDYEPLLEGRFYDYDADPVKMQIGVKFRDVRQMYAKRKLPEETYQAATGAKATVPIIYDDVHAFDVLLDLYDRIGIPGHYIGDFTTVRTSDRSGTEWNITRTISSPEEAETLINEIAVTCGIILSPQPDGTVAPIVLDPEAEPVAIFDSREVTLSKFDGGQKELFTRSMVYYDPLTSDPGESEENYQRLYIIENEEARIAWGESSEKRWFDKWSASETARTALAERMKAWYSVPRMKLTISDVAPRHMGVRLGDLVQIDNLRLPVASAEWPGIVAGRKFLVVSRDFDPKNGTLKIGLSETGTVGTPGAGVAGTTLAISGTLTPYGSGNLYTVTGGSAPYTWSTTLGTLSSTTGESVTLDVSGLSGDGAISVSDATGKVVVRLSALPPQVTAPTYRHTDTGTILSWSPANPLWIKEYEIRLGADWDTASFVAVLRSTELPVGFLPVGVTTYALRAIDQLDHYSGEATILAVTVTAPEMLSITSRVVDNNININWDSIPGSYPIATYRTYRGATWGTAVYLEKIDGTFSARFESSAGSYVYWVQPMDAAGNYGTPKQLTATVSQPPDYVLYSDQTSAFGGTISALTLVHGALVGPVDTAQTWAEHFTDNSWSTPQDQITAGYPLYLQPAEAIGYYEEVIDYGAVIPSTRIRIDPTWSALAGAPTLSAQISTSANGTDWTALAAGFEGWAVDFRYVKFRITVTAAAADLAEISALRIVLDVKLKRDRGQVSAVSTDTTGTEVLFNESFVDVQAIILTPAYQSGVDGIIAQYDFVDAPNPTGMKVFLYRRSDGARISGDISWQTEGV
jgi:hypothetical protein